MKELSIPVPAAGRTLQLLEFLLTHPSGVTPQQCLAELDIRPESIKGYDQEEFTHMSVAVNVLSGAADTGLGIYAAAKALGLDFVPMVTEEYDLVIPEEFFEDERVQLMLEVIRSRAFREHVDQMGGYDTSKTGILLASL